MNIQMEHSVMITLETDDKVKTVTAFRLTPGELHDLTYLCNEEVLKDFKDLGLRYHICKELSDMEPDNWIYQDDLRYNTARSFEPYQPNDDQDIKDRRSRNFDQAFDHVLFDMMVMGVIWIDDRKDPVRVKSTKVGNIILNLLFRD